MSRTFAAEIVHINRHIPLRATKLRFKQEFVAKKRVDAGKILLPDRIRGLCLADTTYLHWPMICDRIYKKRSRPAAVPQKKKNGNRK